jgi:hypothetical protein
LHLCNESTISSFGFEGYFASNFYAASVVSQSNCIVAKADCRQVLSAIQNVDFINTIRNSALARTQWLAMRSHQAVQVMGTSKPIQRAGNYLQSVRMQNFLGTQSYPKGPYRKALMNKEDYDAIALRWREARQDLQQNRLRKFLLVETPLPQVACLYASSVQSSAARSKKMEKSQTLFNATQVHVSTHACVDQVFREARAKPWIAEATAIMKFRKSMNPRASAEEMLRTSSCSRIAAQGFSKVRTDDKQIFNRFVLKCRFRLCRLRLVILHLPVPFTQRELMETEWRLCVQEHCKILLIRFASLMNSPCAQMSLNSFILPFADIALDYVFNPFVAVQRNVSSHNSFGRWCRCSIFNTSQSESNI